MVEERAGGSRGRRARRARRAFGALSLCAAALLGGSRVAGAQASDALRANHRGWEYLVEKLVADGVDRRRVERAFGDPRVEPFTGLDFGLRP
ncbi:MAG: hypothetical protein AB1689_03785, partial [Thermodesulfobacteriota bacterium]